MASDALRQVSREFLTLAAFHHLVLFTILVMFWVRRRSMERLIAGYFAFAFGTATIALATHAGARASAVAAACAAALWVRELARPRTVLSFRETPRARLIVMGLAGAFALIYPGYSDGLPSIVFAPLGVILPPTLIAACALLNCAAPRTDRLLHGALAAMGLVVAVVGAAVERSWVHAPLLVVSLYAIPLVLGKAKTVERPQVAPETSVKKMRDRLYARWTLLPGPRDPRRERWSSRRRGR
jgi:hypothetical protein